ncbi:ExbD/TolR family protein [Thiohalocapsa halophila]
MKLVTHRAPRRRDDHLIPLINVIFLMLIFFMIVGQIRPAEALRVEPPKTQQPTAAGTGERVLVLAPDGRLASDGRILSRKALRAHLTERRARAGASNAAPAPLTLKADAAVSAALLRETLDLLADAGITQVELLSVAADRH